MRSSRYTEITRLLRDESGAATTEGVIVAVFLTTVFALALYLKARHTRVAEMAASVRAEVAAESFAGCRDGRSATIRSASSGVEAASRSTMPALAVEYDAILERAVEARGEVRELGGAEVYGRSRFESVRRSECNPVARDVTSAREVAMRQAYCRSTGNCGAGR